MLRVRHEKEGPRRNKSPESLDGLQSLASCYQFSLYVGTSAGNSLLYDHRICLNVPIGGEYDCCRSSLSCHTATIGGYSYGILHIFGGQFRVFYVRCYIRGFNRRVSHGKEVEVPTHSAERPASEVYMSQNWVEFGSDILLAEIVFSELFPYESVLRSSFPSDRLTCLTMVLPGKVEPTAAVRPVPRCPTLLCNIQELPR